MTKSQTKTRKRSLWLTKNKKKLKTSVILELSIRISKEKVQKRLKLPLKQIPKKAKTLPNQRKPKLPKNFSKRSSNPKFLPLVDNWTHQERLNAL
ncbi:hypothetical protein GUJ93_ZPchr0010g9829 [Zizania palustris]|uniref:Uncharacterized protein n=1 Tax=Zizania palustris TaxID=103762 RepID=A0A8J5WGL5_ZIZPA|nr:hypothetical protein GUJ93_ZPchr0010g9829 [Zizania palustris]